MHDESKRQSYLNAMGVTQWQLRSGHPQAETSPSEVEQPAVKIDNDVDQKDAEVPDPLPESESVDNHCFVKGLKLLNQGSKNGLLVILSEQRKELTPQSRLLMSNMLKGIHFLPSETGFAVISGELESADETVSLESIKAILVLGFEAGRQLVKVAGARIIPGTETFTLNDRKIVVSWHPDELHNKQEYKQQAWNDLKQLVHFFK